ncbi:MAG: fibronectin type III domain-containing protein [Candidatus Paceibacterota bacterium]|jgi:hypothetical protein
MKKTLFTLISAILLTSLFGGIGAVFSQTYYYGNLTVQTTPATNVSSSGAVLNGEINANGYSTTYYFEYGTMSSFGSVTPTQSIDPYNYNKFVSYTLSNLSNNITYYYRLVAYNNNSGTIYGSTQSFNTNTGNYYYNNSTSVSTSPAQNIAATSASLWGLAYANSNTGTAWFEYGTSAGSLTITSPQITINSSDYYNSNNLTPTFWATVNNLNPNTTYYYKAALRNGGNTTYGQVVSFMTTNSYVNPINTYPTNYTYPYYQYQEPQIKYVYVEDTNYDTNYSQQQPTSYFPQVQYGWTYPYYYPTNQVGSSNGQMYSTGQNYPLRASVSDTINNSNLAVIGVALLAILVVLTGVIAFKRA